MLGLLCLALPRRRLSRTTRTDGATQTTVYEWTSPGSVRPAGSSRFASREVDLLRSIGLTDGVWAITLPDDALSLNAAGGVASVAVDFGANGTIDKTCRSGLPALAGAANGRQAPQASVTQRYSDRDPKEIDNRAYVSRSRPALE